jgi:mRNA-degrading endonuclease toxin of MazEF toxin-antitoxin module
VTWYISISTRSRATSRPADDLLSCSLPPRLTLQACSSLVQSRAGSRATLSKLPLPDGLQVAGVILADQIKCLDWKARKAKRVDKALPFVLDAVRHYLSLIFDMK